MLKEMLERVYEAYEGSDVLMDYSGRHGIQSAGVLTVYDDESAALVALSIAPPNRGENRHRDWRGNRVACAPLGLRRQARLLHRGQPDMDFLFSRGATCE